MNPTTLRTVAADLAATIRTITPDYPLYQDKPWSLVPVVKEVPGVILRLASCEWDPPVPVLDGIYGSGIEHITTLRVFANYGGLPDETDQDVHAEIVSSDAQQLWLALEARQDPQLDGLIAVTPTGWSFEDDTPGKLWGSHDFDVRLLLSHD